MHSSRTLAFLALLSLALLATSLPAFAAQSPPTLVGLAKSPTPAAAESFDQMLLRYGVFELDLTAVEQQARSGRLSLHLGNQTFDLLLEPNDLRAPGYQEILRDGDQVTVLPERELVTFKGAVVGDPESIVRLTIEPERLVAYVKTADDWVFIDPVADYDRGADRGDVVVYRDADVTDLESGTCGSGRLHQHALEVESPATPRLPGDPQTMAANTLQVANECDGQYFSSHGNPGSFNRMSGVLNAVDGIYESEINTSISIVAQQCWSNASTDPYTSLNASTTLNQFRNWWNANMGSTSRDVAHQFSGKNFSGSTIGIAWVGVICNNPSLSYGISQDLSSSRQRRRLTAHEIGHNLSAGHDNQSPVCPGVSCNGSGPLMCSSIQGGSSSAADDFSSCSRSSINNHISSVGFCL